MQNLKVGFLTFEQYHGKANIGSSRIRADYLIKYWNQAGEDIGTASRYVFGGKYDVMVFQKVYWPEYARMFKGIKILDLCDADWLDWGYKIKEMIEEMDYITCSSMEIAKFISGITDKPVAFIPDRIDFDGLLPPKKHSGKSKNVAWYGYAENFSQLDPAIPAIRKRKLDLYVISSKGYVPPVTEREGYELHNLNWSPSTWQADLQKADIVVLPQIKNGRFKYKSDNKITQAWALGLPVAFLDKDLDRFASENERQKEADEKYKLVKEQYDCKQSVVELKDIIKEIYEGKRN